MLIFNHVKYNNPKVSEFGRAENTLCKFNMEYFLKLGLEVILFSMSVIEPCLHDIIKLEYKCNPLQKRKWDFMKSKSTGYGLNNQSI